MGYEYIMGDVFAYIYIYISIYIYTHPSCDRKTMPRCHIVTIRTVPMILDHFGGIPSVAHSETLLHSPNVAPSPGGNITSWIAIFTRRNRRTKWWCLSNYPPGIKHGLRENPPFLDDLWTIFPLNLHRGFSS